MLLRNRPRSNHSLAAALVAALMFVTGSGWPRAALAEWQLGWSVTPYGWLAGVNGSITTPSDPGDGGTLPPLLGTELDGELEEIGFMFHAAFFGERWMAFADSVWVNVGQGARLNLGPIPTGSRVDATIDGNVYTLAAGYRLTDWPRSSLAVYAGGRHYGIEARIEASGGLLPGTIVSAADRSFTDAVIGLKWSQALGRRWHLSASADLGFGESDTSGEIAATLAYRLSTVSVIGGYRYLVLDAGSADYDVDLSMFGPMIGVGLRF